MTIPACSRIPVVLLSLLVCTFAGDAQVPGSTKLDFNDLGSSPGGTHMPDRYAGFRWQTSNWHFMTLPTAPNDNFLALSGTSTSVISNTGADFIFDGATLWSRRGADANGSCYFYLTRNGVVVYDGREDDDGRLRFTSAKQFFKPNHTGPVDVVAIVFTQGGGDWDHLAMDDFLFHGLESAQPASKPAITKHPDHWKLDFQGTAGQPYRIDYTTDLASGNWSQLGVATADDLGFVRFNDPVSTDAARFYRAAAP